MKIQYGVHVSRTELHAHFVPPEPTPLRFRIHGALMGFALSWPMRIILPLAVAIITGTATKTALSWLLQ